MHESANKVLLVHLILQRSPLQLHLKYHFKPGNIWNGTYTQIHPKTTHCTHLCRVLTAGGASLQPRLKVLQLLLQYLLGSLHGRLALVAPASAANMVCWLRAMNAQAVRHSAGWVMGSIIVQRVHLQDFPIM